MQKNLSRKSHVLDAKAEIKPIKELMDHILKVIKATWILFWIKKTL